MRDKLIELIDNNKACPFDCPCEECTYKVEPSCFSPRLADELIANGVTIGKDNNVITNADRIRAMTDEELAEAMCNNSNCDYCNFNEGWKGCTLKDWLKQPVEDNK